MLQLNLSLIFCPQRSTCWFYDFQSGTIRMKIDFLIFKLFSDGYILKDILSIFERKNEKAYYVHAGTNGLIQNILKRMVFMIRESKTFMVSSKFMTGAYRFGCVFRLVFLKEKWSKPTAWKIEKSLGWLHNGACNKKNWPPSFAKSQFL